MSDTEEFYQGELFSAPRPLIGRRPVMRFRGFRANPYRQALRLEYERGQKRGALWVALIYIAVKSASELMTAVVGR